MRAGAIVSVAAALAAASTSAQDQQPRSQPGWPCVGRPDPSYFKIAEATGGQVFLFDKSEIGSSAIVAIAAGKYEETVFRAAGSLAAGRHEFSFPIDSTIEAMMVSVSLQCLESVDIVRPSGQLLESMSTAAEIHAFRAGRVATLPHPEHGRWRVRVAGHGMFFLVAQAKSDLSLDRVEFVREGGRPGHEGLFAIHEPPRAGVPQLLAMELAGTMSGVRARVVTSAFDDAGAIVLRESPGATNGREFVASVVPPAAAFRVVVSGLDPLGLPFQRVYAPLFEPR